MWRSHTPVVSAPIRALVTVTAVVVSTVRKGPAHPAAPPVTERCCDFRLSLDIFAEGVPNVQRS